MSAHDKAKPDCKRLAVALSNAPPEVTEWFIFWPVSRPPDSPVSEGCNPMDFIFSAHSLLWYALREGLPSRYTYS
jgi:hypothetical protein